MYSGRRQEIDKLQTDWGKHVWFGWTCLPCLQTVMVTCGHYPQHSFWWPGHPLSVDQGCSITNGAMRSASRICARLHGREEKKQGGAFLPPIPTSKMSNRPQETKGSMICLAKFLLSQAKMAAEKPQNLVYMGQLWWHPATLPLPRTGVCHIWISISPYNKMWTSLFCTGPLKGPFARWKTYTWSYMCNSMGGKEEGVSASSGAWWFLSLTSISCWGGGGTMNLCTSSTVF